MPIVHDIQIFHSDDALAAYAAGLFVQAARESIAARGRFTVALTGGSSPHKTYELLASAPQSKEVDWSKTFVFLGDERFVPDDDERSNYGMCRRLLLSQVPLRPEQVFPIPTDTDTPGWTSA